MEMENKRDLSRLYIALYCISSVIFRFSRISFFQIIELILIVRMFLYDLQFISREIPNATSMKILGLSISRLVILIAIDETMGVIINTKNILERIFIGVILIILLIIMFFIDFNIKKTGRIKYCILKINNVSFTSLSNPVQKKIFLNLVLGRTEYNIEYHGENFKIDAARIMPMESKILRVVNLIITSILVLIGAIGFRILSFQFKFIIFIAILSIFLIYMYILTICIKRYILNKINLLDIERYQYTGC